MNGFCCDAPSARVTEEIGAAFATRAATPLVLWLMGDLGSGKTAFGRSFIHSLGYDGRVTSPTYTLLEVYAIGAIQVLHLDFYRLETPRDLLEIGLEEYLDEHSVCLIEWPENIAAGVPDADVKLRFGFAGEGRRIFAEAHSDTGVSLLAAVAGQLARGVSSAGV